MRFPRQLWVCDLGNIGCVLILLLAELDSVGRLLQLFALFLIPAKQGQFFTAG